MQTSLGGGVTFGQASSGGVGLSGGAHPVIDAGIGVSYAIDMVGRIRREIEAASADAQAQAAAADLARITVVANVVGA